MNDFPQMPPPPAPVFNAIPGPAQAKQESPVDRALSALSGQLAELERAVENLVSRVAPVLTPLTPQAPTAADGKVQIPGRADLTKAIDEKAARTATLVQVVKAVTARVEL